MAHDESKDKQFELEMSWICDESDKKYQYVPNELIKKAYEEAKVFYLIYKILSL